MSGGAWNSALGPRVATTNQHLPNVSTQQRRPNARTRWPHRIPTQHTGLFIACSVYQAWDPSLPRKGEFALPSGASQHRADRRRTYVASAILQHGAAQRVEAPAARMLGCPALAIANDSCSHVRECVAFHLQPPRRHHSVANDEHAKSRAICPKAWPTQPASCTPATVGRARAHLVCATWRPLPSATLRAG